MAQLFSALFFSMACITAVAMIAGLLRGEWARMVAILSGRELERARAATPRVRVRMRGWGSPQPRRTPQPLRAAA